MKINPCPNQKCASTNIRMDQDTKSTWVTCTDCWTTGPTIESRDEAIAAWNSLGTDEAEARIKELEDQLAVERERRKKAEPYLKQMSNILWSDGYCDDEAKALDELINPQPEGEGDGDQGK